jgi:hypothetical protein
MDRNLRRQLGTSPTAPGRLRPRPRQRAWDPARTRPPPRRRAPPRRGRGRVRSARPGRTPSRAPLPVPARPLPDACAPVALAGPGFRWPQRCWSVCGPDSPRTSWTAPPVLRCISTPRSGNAATTGMAAVNNRTGTRVGMESRARAPHEDGPPGLAGRATSVSAPVHPVPGRLLRAGTGDRRVVTAGSSPVDH